MLAAESLIASGTPVRSTTRWRLEPGLPRSGGFGPVSGGGTGRLAPPVGRDARRVQRGARPVNLVGIGQPLEQHSVQSLPDACLVPIAKPSPAGHPTATAHLTGQELPADAALQ